MFNSGRAKPGSDHMDGGGLGRLGGRARDKRESAFSDPLYLPINLISRDAEG